MAGAQDEDAAFRSAVLQVELMPTDEVLAMAKSAKAELGGRQLALVAVAIVSKARLCASLVSWSIRDGDAAAALEGSGVTRVLLREGEALLAHAGEFEGRDALLIELEAAKEEIEAMLGGAPSALELKAKQSVRAHLAQQPQASGCGGVILFGLLLVVAATRVAMELVGA